MTLIYHLNTLNFFDCLGHCLFLYYQLKYNFIKNSYKTKIVVNEQFKIKTNDEKEYLIN